MPTANFPLHVVILAGGSGLRLWPLSNSTYPKQFLKLRGDRSLLQETVLRFLSKLPPSAISIVTNQKYAPLIAHQLKEIATAEEGPQIIVEPEAKNTGPAIALAFHELLKKGIDLHAPVLISPSDSVIDPVSELFPLLEKAAEKTVDPTLILFGITPQTAETGYGYIELHPSDPTKALRFLEKPNLAAAKAMVASKRFLWNSGMICTSIASFIEATQKHAPPLAKLILGTNPLSLFHALPSISIDHALLEKIDNLSILPLSCFWSDIGSWDALCALKEKDDQGNVFMGNIVSVETKNSFIIGSKKPIVTIGIEELLIIETEEALFVGKKGDSQKVKAAVEELKTSGLIRTESVTQFANWGEISLLEDGDLCLIRRVRIEPLQKAFFDKIDPEGHWSILQGVGAISSPETAKESIQKNSHFYWPATKHLLIENQGASSLDLIWIQGRV